MTLAAPRLPASGSISGTLYMSRIDDYDYALPPELVAQYPWPHGTLPGCWWCGGAPREIFHAAFKELPAWLDKTTSWWSTTPGLPAACWDARTAAAKWNCCSTTCRRRRKRRGPGPGHTPGSLKIGQSSISGGADATVLAWTSRGWRRWLHRHGRRRRGRGPGGGEVPLPPYIQRRPKPRTVRPIRRSLPLPPGGGLSTAGLHFTEMCCRIWKPGGLKPCASPPRRPGTFMPVRQADYTATGCCRNILSYPQPRRRASTPPEPRESAGGGGHHQRPVLEHCASPRGFQAQQGVRSLYLSGINSSRGPDAHQLPPAKSTCAVGKRFAGGN